MLLCGVARASVGVMGGGRLALDGSLHRKVTPVGATLTSLTADRIIPCHGDVIETGGKKGTWAGPAVLPHTWHGPVLFEEILC